MYDVAAMKKQAVDLAELSEVYRSLLEMGSVLMKLLDDEKNVAQVARMAYELFVIAQIHNFREKGDDTGTSGLSAVFFDLHEYSDLYDTFYPGGYADYIHTAKERLEYYRSEPYLNPAVIEDDKALIMKYILPILSEMVSEPYASPVLFIKLARELDNLVKEQDLSVIAAGGELLYSLDRPQIESHLHLQKAVCLAYALERPHMLRQKDAEQAWNEFMDAVENVDSRMDGVS